MKPAREPPAWEAARDPRPLAVTAATLFLVNLMLAPGLGFLVLAALWATKRRMAPGIARQHLDQAMRASLAGGAFLALTVVMALVGGLKSPGTWVVVILYFTVVHSSLILLGVIALVKAINRQPWRYPLVG